MSNYSQRLKNMENLVSRCEETEAAFRAIKTRLENLPKSESVEQLLRQTDLDIAVAAKSTQIAREALKQETGGLPEIGCG